jgi:hypothetical protein
MAEKKTKRRKIKSSFPAAVGRPTDYNQQVASEICQRIADGETLRQICSDKSMPCMASIFLWLKKHPEFSEQYTRAKETQLEGMADETLDIADNSSNDWMERNDPKNPGWIANGEVVNRSRLRVDTRKWLLSKLAPKRYGDLIGKYELPPPPPVEVDSMAIARRVAVMLLTAARNQDVEDVVVKEKK